ncbi:MAG: ABC transporter permease, partial [Candidatus Bathyarchaeia archaeon]
WTIFVTSISLTISFMIGVSLGMLIAYRRGRLIDTFISLFSSISSAIPAYIIALLLLMYLGFTLRLFPTGGIYDINVSPGFNLPFIFSVLHHASLPIISYVIVSFGTWTLAMKGSTISVLGEDYVAAAEARGLRKRRIIFSYVGRTAILPLATSLAINIGYMFGGAIFIETVFSYRGIGYLLSAALSLRDYPVIQGCFFVITTAIILANFITDVAYSKLDPRIRFE